MINRGTYAPADEFLHLQMSPKKLLLNAHQQESHLKKFWAEVLARNEDVQAENDENDVMEDNIHHELSVSAEELDVAGVALLSLKEVFRQAAILLSKNNSIMEHRSSNLHSWLRATGEGCTTLRGQKVAKWCAMTVLTITLERYVHTL